MTPDDVKKLAGLVHLVGADESMNDRAQKLVVPAIIQALVEHKAINRMSVGKCEKSPPQKGGIYTNGERCFSISG